MNLESHIRAGDVKIIEAEEHDIREQLFNLKPPPVMWQEEREGEGYARITEYWEPANKKTIVQSYNPENNSFTVRDERGNVYIDYGY